MSVKIFTDGSSLGNPGPGGFCALIKIGDANGGKTIVVKGGDAATTNNRMEMSAIIAGLYMIYKKFPKERACEVYSDSSLILDTLKKGWKRKKNLDLWKKLDHIISKFNSISWNWIKGHSGHPENEKADSIAVSEAKKRKRALQKALLH